MAFKDWLTSDGHFMLFYPWLESEGDKFVEHGHRLLGATAGFLSIALVIVCFKCEPRRWVRNYSLIILGGVMLQGLLGGLRIILDERIIALIHGCTGPAFFALCVGMVVVTSRWWHDAPQVDLSPGARKFLRMAMLVTTLAFSQLVAGAVLRHSPRLTSDSAAVIFQLAVYFHLFLAAAIVVHCLMLMWQSYRNSLECGRSGLLLGFVCFQILLGASTWLVKYGMPRWAGAIVGDPQFVNTADNALQAGIVTCHVAVGSLILVIGLTIVLRTARQLRISIPEVFAPSKQRMEAAL